ncbi:hypothetical protein ACLKA7_011946 [Drosophila subpalustris]
MKNDDYQPLLRRRRNSYLKWTESQVLEFLELVLDLVNDVPESLEKPTAQKFYTKVMESVQEWLIYHCKQLKSSLQSPDFNPIEHVWDSLETRIRKHQISSKEMVKTALTDEWAKISAIDTNNLVKSMQRRLKAVRDSKGGPTKYSNNMHSANYSN